MADTGRSAPRRDVTPRADRVSAVPVAPDVDRPARAPAGVGTEPDASRSPWRRGVWAAVAVVGLAVVTAVALSGGGGGGSPEPGGDDGSGPAAGDAGGPHPIVAATDVDPHGGDGEHPEDVELAFDGDPGTAWPTQRYSTAAFGGLKPGVGIAFDLGEPVEVSQVELLLGTPGADLEIYASDTPFGGTEFGDPVGAIADAPAEPTIDVGRSAGRFWLVWFTSVPGGRAEVVEATFARPA